MSERCPWIGMQWWGPREDGEKKQCPGCGAGVEMKPTGNGDWYIPDHERPRDGTPSE